MHPWLEHEVVVASALPDTRKIIAERSHAAPGARVPVRGAMVHNHSTTSRACAPEGVGQEGRHRRDWSATLTVT